MYPREKTKEIQIGNIKIGGGNPIAIQSMTNTDTRDIAKTVAQIKALENAGCEIIRVAVVDETAANAIAEIKKQISIPIVADIHFDHRLALASIKAGADKLRLNPGNISGRDKIKAVVDAAKDRNMPIRIGVNSGSLDKALYEKHGGVTPQALVESALGHVAILEELNFHQIVIAIKASTVKATLDSYAMISEKVDYPLHIGITEAGTLASGTIKSAVGIGAVLAMGIGDTIRVSLTDDPLEEVKCAKEILKAMELRAFGPRLVSCPTCGRTEIDIINIAKEVEARLHQIDKNVKIAVMGCAVNGPGEAREADFGIAGGRGFGFLFKKGSIIKKIPEESLVDELFEEIRNC